jgi:hypothetical protein
MGRNPVENANIVLASNIFCMCIDILIVATLTLYWQNIQGSFTTTTLSREFTVKIRFLPAIIWSMLYLGYYCYLFI